jgi:hypothetical protein
VALASVYIKLNLLSVFSAHPQIKKITLTDGKIYLFKQTNGYSNVYLFGKKDSAQNKGNGLEFHQFGIENVTFTFDNYLRNKQFKARFNNMDGVIYPEGDTWKITARTEAHIFQLGFNLAKGGYLKDKDLEGKLHMVFHKKNKKLDFPRQPVTIGGVPILLKAGFLFSEKPATFTLDINAPSINFQKGMHMLTPNIYHKMERFKVDKNIAAHALIAGTFLYPDTPNVHVYIQVKNNSIYTPYGQLTEVNANPEFQNNIERGKGMGDANSGILIRHFTGAWEGIPIIADSTLIYGLLHPLLVIKVHSRFPIERLNHIVGNSFEIKKGTANLNISYHGPVTKKDTFQRNLNGFLTFKDAAITYLPRNLNFQNCRGTLLFKGEDVLLKNVILSSQKSTLKINGVSRKFLNAYFNDPSKAVFDWNINSSLIDLNEFKSILEPRKEYSAAPGEKNRKVRKINRQLDIVLAKSTMRLNVNVQKVVYRRFRAQDIKGNLTFAESGIKLQDISLDHAGGSIFANGNIYQNEKGNPFYIKAKVNNVQVDQLFYAFENFGQETIHSDNIKGSFSANISLNGGLSNTGSVIKNSFDGHVSFHLKNGQLNNFPPFITISKFIFKKRHLDHITFETLSDDLDIKDGKIYIYPMEINSSAIRMKVEGVYALGKGTDISMIIPLRNPQKDKDRIAEGLTPKKNKGIVLYLRARDGDDGKVHISWDPLKKGIGQQDSLFSTEQRQANDSASFSLP